MSDPRQNMNREGFRNFIQTANRKGVKKEETIAMLNDPKIPCFVVIQEANEGGEYWRFLWTADGKCWKERTEGIWTLGEWEKTFELVSADKIYEKNGQKFKAVKIKDYHVRFDRLK